LERGSEKKIAGMGEYGVVEDVEVKTFILRADWARAKEARTAPEEAGGYALLQSERDEKA